MDIMSNNDQYRHVTTLYKNESNKNNRENMKQLSNFYSYYGLAISDVDETLIEDSFKGDSKFFYKEYTGDIELGNVGVVHDLFGRKLSFFQNNVKVYEANLDEVTLNVHRSFLAQAFIRICHFYVPKRFVRSTYVTSGIFNPDFSVLGEATMHTADVLDLQQPGVMWTYSKTINPVNINNYFVPIEMIAYTKNDKTTDIIDVTQDIWNDEQYVDVILNDKFIQINGKGIPKKIRFD